MQDFKDDLLITPGTAASMLAVSTQTLRHYENKGLIKAAMRSVGGQRRYRLSDIRALLQDFEVAERPAPSPEELESFVGEEAHIPLAKLF